MGWLEERDQAVLDFFNHVKTTAEITALIKDDPGAGGKSSRTYGIRPSLAKRILETRDSLPGGKFTSMNQIDSIGGVGPDTLNDIYYSKQPASLAYPVLLFPVRLESRFKGNKLLLRIYPDDISIETHNRALTPPEKEAGLAFWRSYNQAPNPEEKQGIWRKFAGDFGNGRAAWIAKKTAAPSNDEPGSNKPVVRVLPDYFKVTLYQGENVYTFKGKDIPHRLALIAEFSTASHDVNNPLFDNEAKWVHNFNTAVDKGMALLIDLNPLPDKDHIDRIVVTGIKRNMNHEAGQKLVEELIENHLYTHGFSFLPYGTPTNNTQTVKSAYTRTSPLFENGPLPNLTGAPSGADSQSAATRLAEMLGVNQALLGLAGNGDQTVESSFTEPLYQALWLGMGDYYLTALFADIIPKTDRDCLWNHFHEYVRARGPLPAFRAGKQPYGILPVGTINNWNETDNFTRGLYGILKNLFSMWRELTENPELVPRVGFEDDPDLELLRILSMSPRSMSYQARMVIDDRLFPWLLTNADKDFLGENADNITRQWINTWFQKVASGLQTLKKITGDTVADEQWLNSHLLRSCNWDLDNPLSIPLVQDKTNGNPLAYLNLFSSQSNTIPPEDNTKPLLYHLLRFAFILQNNTTYPCALMEEPTLRSAIDAMIVSSPDPDDLESHLHDILDLHTHRLDAWITSLATKRLQTIRKQSGRSQGVYIGAYGWVEDLNRVTGGSQANQGGYIHGPGLGQAAAGAVLRNGYLTHQYDPEGNLFKINLESARVRRALRIIEGVREGQDLGALLGFLFERGLHERREDHFINIFRNLYPLAVTEEAAAAAADAEITVEAVAARNVVDGLKLARAWRDNPSHVWQNIDEALTNIGVNPPILSESAEEALSQLTDALDSVTDLLLYESVYQAVQGNHERSGAALAAFAGAGLAPEIESVKTKPDGVGFGQKVCLIFNRRHNPLLPKTPREMIEPVLNAWFDQLLGPRNNISCTVYVDGYLDAQGQPYDPVDLNQASQSELQSRLGLSPGVAAAIVSYRDQNGPFFRFTDLAKISLIDLDRIPLSDRIQIVHTVNPRDRKWRYEDLEGRVTINPMVVRLHHLSLSPLDFLYLAATPPGQGETELEQRIKYYIRQENFLDPNSELTIDFDCTGGYPGRSFAEAIELARRVFNLVAGAAYLRPESFVPADWAAEYSFGPNDCKLLRKRVQNAYQAFSELESYLSLEGDDPDPVVYQKISLYGVEGSIPASPMRDPDPLGRKTSVLKIMGKKLEKCRKLMLEADGNEPAQSIEGCIAALKVLFGKSFVVMPAFSNRALPSQEIFSNTYQQGMLGIKDTERIIFWLQQAAETHPAVRRLEDMLMAITAWQTGEDGLQSAASLTPRVIQAPQDQYPWLGLADDELPGVLNNQRLQAWKSRIAEGGRPRGVQSLVCLIPPDLVLQEPLAGLIIDQWEEFIPSDSQVTGLSFQYDRPNSQAPQALLLAVPGSENPAAGWTDDDLTGIVNDTMDLARIRAVDLDAFQEVGLFSPGLFFPTQPEKPDWRVKKSVILDAEFGGFTVNSQLTRTFEFKGFVFRCAAQDPLPEVKNNTSPWAWYNYLMQVVYPPFKYLEFGKTGITIDLPWPVSKVLISAGPLSSSPLKYTAYDRANRQIEEGNLSNKYVYMGMPTSEIHTLNIGANKASKIVLSGPGIVNQIAIFI